MAIDGALDDGTIYVQFENLTRPRRAHEDVTEDDTAEAAMECVRRVAQDSKKRPKVIISGKKGDEAKWQEWQTQFEQHDLSKPSSDPGLNDSAWGAAE